jgi:hypothetical protein
MSRMTDGEIAEIEAVNRRIGGAGTVRDADAIRQLQADLAAMTAERDALMAVVSYIARFGPDEDSQSQCRFALSNRDPGQAALGAS